jgi:hypothetical protein
MMNTPRLSVVVLLFAIVALGRPRTAAPDDWFGLRKHAAAAAAPPAPCNPPLTVVGSPPGPYRHPSYPGGNCPWYGYGFGVPTYGWGYFGVSYRPAVICHHGYYDDYTQWGYRRGY